MTWPLEIKAEALALFSAGYGRDYVEKALKAAHGTGPGHSALIEWKREAVESGLIREQSEELAIRYGNLLHRAADHLDTLPGEQLVKHILPMNAVRGTNQDKLRDSSAPQQTFNFILVKDQAPSAEPSAQSPVQPSTEGKALSYEMDSDTRMELPPTLTEPKAE